MLKRVIGEMFLMLASIGGSSEVVARETPPTYKVNKRKVRRLGKENKNGVLDRLIDRTTWQIILQTY